MGASIEVTPKFLDIHTPEGLEHAIQFCRKYYPQAEHDCVPLAKSCRKLRDSGRYIQAMGGVEDWHLFCREVLKADGKFIDKIIEGVSLLEAWEGSVSTRDAVAAAEKAGPLAGHGAIGRGRDRVDTINSNDTQGGTSQDYTLRRLLRDDPALFDEVKAGKLTPNKAAIKAGFRSPPLTITARTKPQEAAKRIIDKLGTDYAQALIDALIKGCDRG